MYAGTRRWVRVDGLGCAVVAAFLAMTLAGAAAVAAASMASRRQEPAATLPVSARHSIGIAFYYDFTKTPACSAVVTKNCVAKFEVLDISVPGLQHLLFTMPVPPGAMGKHFPVQGTSPSLKFVIGKHRLGVSAITPENVRSDPALCQTIVTIGATQ
jgi:hypothetical protein